MNLILKELKDYALSFAYWSIGILVMVGGGLGKWAGFNAGTMDMTSILNTLPKVFLAIFGAANVPLDTIEGFYGIIYLYVLIMGAVFAVLLGSGILAKEERDKTAEFLMVKPIKRTSIFILKFIVAFIYVVLYVLVTYGLSVGLLLKVSPDYPMSEVLIRMMEAMFLIMLVFLSLSMFLASVLGQAKQSSNLALIAVLGGYLLSVFLSLFDQLAFLRFLAPFNWFTTSDLILKGLDTNYVWISIGLTLIALFMALFAYPRRDLRI